MIPRLDRLRTSRPFLPIVLTITGIVSACSAAAGALLSRAYIDDPQTYPLFATSATIMAIAVAAVGWGVGSWVSHRNARVQHTINLLSSRYSQATFVQHLSSFVDHFGPEPQPLITRADIDALTRSATETERSAARSVRYLLNYFEFIASGIHRGHIDVGIVRENWRGMICYNLDRSRPYVDALREDDLRIYEHLVRLREDFRKPPPRPHGPRGPGGVTARLPPAGSARGRFPFAYDPVARKPGVPQDQEGRSHVCRDRHRR